MTNTNTNTNTDQYYTSIGDDQNDSKKKKIVNNVIALCVFAALNFTAGYHFRGRSGTTTVLTTTTTTPTVPTSVGNNLVRSSAGVGDNCWSDSNCICNKGVGCIYKIK
mmetsp:Transcript_11167/g.12750  ORF Transcript_11167/g.12750 Transcript_11167/m.12750 type:complete len:108 (+) Transcript_11167:36-359(+)